MNRLIPVLAALLLGSCATAPSHEAPAASLDRLVEAYFDELLELNPTFATDLGDHR